MVNGITELIFHIVKYAHVAAVLKEDVIGVNTCQKTDKIGFVLVNEALQMGKLMADSGRLVHDVHAFIIVGFH